MMHWQEAMLSNGTISRLLGGDPSWVAAVSTQVQYRLSFDVSLRLELSY